MKKLLLGLGSVAAVAAPIALVVSCGDKATPNSFSAELDSAKTTLTVHAGAVTRVAANVAAGVSKEFHMSAYNANEIVLRILEQGFAKYKDITTVKVIIDGVSVAGDPKATGHNVKVTTLKALTTKPTGDAFTKLVKDLKALFTVLILT
ncbi:MAG: hypothetical protein KAG91_01205 [Mycoplasmataceae bacterium]|nr:hypothetical protein [Mycoplasmataceae bacterium]